MAPGPRTRFVGTIFAALLALPCAALSGTTAPFSPGKTGWAVTTNTSSSGASFNQAGPVAKVWDLTNRGSLALPTIWKSTDTPAPVEFTPTDVSGRFIWSGQNLGQIFGLAIDDDSRGPFIYATASAVYGSVVVACTTSTCYHGSSDLSAPLAASSAPFSVPPDNYVFAKDPSVSTDPSGALFGAVWRLSLNGQLAQGSATYELIANIPSNRMSLGQIAFNPRAQRFYVSNFDDGMIYTFKNPLLNSPPQTVFPAADIYDHGVDGRAAAGLTPKILDDPHTLFTGYGRRVWGLQYNAKENRLYYAVWNIDFRHQVSTTPPTNDPNQIWSVALDSQGRPDPSAGVRKEIDLPIYPGGLPQLQESISPNPAVKYSEPVSDIAFNQTGEVMLLAERGERIGRDLHGGYDSSAEGNSALPHDSRILRYRKVSGAWVRDTGSDYGEYAGDTSNNGPTSGYHGNRTNSGGGVDFGNAYTKDAAGNNIIDIATPDGWAWNTVNSYLTLGQGHLYGLQGGRLSGPSAGRLSDAGPSVILPSGQDVIFLDYDDDLGSSPKTMIGDVEVHRIAAAGGGSILKICKVAGDGVDDQTPFTFSATGDPNPIVVPAGPGPGGYCVVGPSYQTGANVAVTETGPAGYTVTSIVVAPLANRIGAADLSQGTVHVAMGTGVTEVTYTNERHTGYIEICKSGDVDGIYTFAVPGHDKVDVPAGACSPALLENAGPLVITELNGAPNVMLGCSTIPAGRLVGCNLVDRTATITVAPGDISNQTIVFVTNGYRKKDTDDDRRPAGRR